MSSPADTPTPELSARERAEISSLADGTLDPGRRAEVQARIDASPELRALYERERRVVEMLHRARTTDRAPASLRARIEAQRPSGATRARRRFVYGAALAGALAVAVVALTLILPAGTPVAPSVSQAAALGALGPAAPAPAGNPDAPNALLDRSVEDLYFPNWLHDFGWRATGQRVDRLGGRTAVTVYYEYKGHTRVYTIAYTIVGSPALKAPVGATNWLHGVQLRTLTLDGRRVVTWRRGEHTCVLSGNGVPVAVLQRLAAWKPSAQDRS